MTSNKKLVILAIQEAHDSSAALSIGGEIVAAAQEERFTNMKGDYGFPSNAIEVCLNEAKLESCDIDRVILASEKWNPVLTKIKRNANFSVDDWILEQNEYWYPTIFQNKKICYYDLFKDRNDFKYDNFYPMDNLLQGYMDEKEMQDLQKIRKSTVATILNLPLERIETVNHELCHHFYAYYGSPLRGEVLSLTSEGIGDYSNGTVFKFSENGFEKLASTTENHIGHIYQYITLLLGMKPNQHEYKVMGLAPYANSKEVDKSYKIFKRILKVDDLNVVFDQKPSDLYFHFKDALAGHRFDGIAGAVQRFTESILSKWFSACIKATGIRRFIFSGGVAQNIKAVKKLNEIEDVEDIYVCPAAGDTSLPIGACYFGIHKYAQKEDSKIESILPIRNIYLGNDITDEKIESFMQSDKTRNRYEVHDKIKASEVANLLADGKIVARCVGRMEFGLRALGNRSIMADPRFYDNVRKINEAIKFRDFWMPFTPTILAEYAKDYIINEKGSTSPFMTMAFDTTEKAKIEIPAALHPADFTVRPQILEEWQNPQYYDIINEFEKITGVGAILNTSFNLHGDPIANCPEHAIRTLDNSNLDGLLLGDYLILKYSSSNP